MPPNADRTVLICCGGGTDSTALIDYYLRKDFIVRGLHFDYGQIACPGEQHAVSAIADYYRVSIVKSELRPTLVPREYGEFPTRNALFVLAATAYFDGQNGLISLGIHSGTQFYDCSPAFVLQMQQLLDAYFGGRLVLDAPFLAFDKAAIYSYCRDYQVPVDLTYSCQRHPNKPCGVCLSCLDRSRYDFSM